MYIIQMADLHIGAAVASTPKEDTFIRQMADLIKKKIPQNETILICLCGDIIDSRKLEENLKDEVSQRYSYATKLINMLKNEIEDNYKIILKCCPGNHDITHMDEYNAFVKSVDVIETPSVTKLKTCYTVEIENLEAKIIFVNSCNGDQHKKGSIDYESLEKELQQTNQDYKKILVMHHAVMSMFEDDESSIRNAAKLVNLIDKYNVMGVLHGHIHGREILDIGKNHCTMIGTGALWSRNNPNVNSQFNIIELKGNTFAKILNCRFQADGGDDPWDCKRLNSSRGKNIFKAEKFSIVYKELLDELTVVPLIYNMRMEIETTYDAFASDLKQMLSQDSLKIGDKEWDYFELAKMWQAEEIPEELYFNHGSYFKIGEKSGLDYVAEALKQNLQVIELCCQHIIWKM